MKRLLVVHSVSHLKAVEEAEACESLTIEEVRLSRTVHRWDSREYSNDIEGNGWEPLAGRLQDFVANLKAELNQESPGQLRFVGIDEVPTMIALGAYLGDEVTITCPDFDRDAGKFCWPATELTVQFEAHNLPESRLELSGAAVLRVELSAAINDSDVDDVVPRNQRLADISIRLLDSTPAVARIRSQADLDSFRRVLREALAVLHQRRPGTALIHLFFAGPVSAAITAGQELRLRNGTPVQTYRYRSSSNPRLKDAILLTPDRVSAIDAPVTDDERQLAASIRDMWRTALRQVVEHGITRRQSTGGRGWPAYLSSEITAGYCGPKTFPPIWELALAGDSISAESRESEFAFDAVTRTWAFEDRMLLRMHDACGRDETKTTALARAFLWHEYLHLYQWLTGNTAPNIGAFANCLERIDYFADLYGVMHQVDFGLTASPKPVGAPKTLLSASISEALDAFWTFEPPPPTRHWQQRRLRRYLNWYWRGAEVDRLLDIKTCVTRLSTPPVIEVSGPPLSTARSRRIEMDLMATVRGDHREIALVDQDEVLFRQASGPTLSVDETLKAFVNHETTAIREFFGALYEHVNRKLVGEGTP